MRGVVTAIALSRKTGGTIRQGLVWAFAYNLLLIPIAMGALYPLYHLQLSPMRPATAMAMSSVSVVNNALRLRHFRRPDTPRDSVKPSLRTRVAEYACPGGIALLALAIGAAALWLGAAAGS